jgi:stress response protein YsnF
VIAQTTASACDDRQGERANMTSEHANPEEIAIPLFEEQASVVKRRVVTGRVQVFTATREHEQMIDELLAREHVEIERTPINKQVETAPAVRQEGDTTIIPIVEEILVLERRLLLTEEVRVRRVHSTESHRERVILRRQEATITRDPVVDSAVPSPDTDVAVNTDKENKGEQV